MRVCRYEGWVVRTSYVNNRSLHLIHSVKKSSILGRYGYKNLLLNSKIVCSYFDLVKGLNQYNNPLQIIIIIIYLP